MPLLARGGRTPPDIWPRPPALEGFSPTPEMPVIAKAQMLLAALVGTRPRHANAN
jgi:hypothetical protein